MRKFTLLIGITGILFSCKGLNQTEENTVSTEEQELGKKIERLGNGIARVYQDSQNNYWFAHKGVVKYDGKTLVQYTVDDGLYANRVRDIFEDHLGNMYFDTGEGINKFDGKTMEKLTVTDDPKRAEMFSENDLWFAGKWTMNGVYRYDGEHLYHLKLPKHELHDEAKKDNPNTSNFFYSNYTTFIDKSNNLWIGNSIFGACRFDGENFFWVSELEMTEMDSGPAMGVRSIAQDKEGNFYFASNVSSKYKVVELDGITTYEKLPGVPTAVNPDIDNACISMVIDNDDNIWMAHYKGGIWKYDGESFTHYPILVNNEEAELFSVYKDRNGTLWLGTHNAGAWRFNGEKFIRFEAKVHND